MFKFLEKCFVLENVASLNSFDEKNSTFLNRINFEILSSLINWKHQRKCLVAENLEKANSLIEEFRSESKSRSKSKSKFIPGIKNNPDYFKILEKIILYFVSPENKNNFDKNFLEVLEIKNFHFLMTHSLHSIRILIKILIQFYISILSLSNSNQVETIQITLSNKVENLQKSFKNEKCENRNKCDTCTKEFVKNILNKKNRPISSTPMINLNGKTTPNKLQTLNSLKSSIDSNMNMKKRNTIFAAHAEYVSKYNYKFDCYHL
jgi:hypothetical protein